MEKNSNIYKEGKELICIKSLIIKSETNLTKDKTYKISGIYNGMIAIKNDLGNNHYFDIEKISDDYYGKWLKIVNNKEKATRYNEGKPKWSLIHYESLVPMIRVLEFGRDNYGEGNWKKGMDKKEILESMQRHLAALMDGEENDSQTGISHMGHIQCNAMFYNYFNK